MATYSSGGLSGYSTPAGNRFAVAIPGHHGPDVTFWPNYRSVIRLLSSHCRCHCADTVSVWERASVKGGKWKPITN